ncbi:MAG: hypothetical protein GWO24_38065, partial [Akkermansiaceae bacterium]|nr:hypothetical protein [Akkermansiaceae bacterium]
RPTVHPIDEVRLYYRHMFLREIMVPMTDDGSAADLVAGDGIYTGEVPTDTVRRGQMVRWRVEAEDTTGEVRIDPAFGDP